MSGYLVQTQLRSFTLSGAPKKPSPGGWQTRSGYGSKASAQREARMWRAKRNGRKAVYNVRVVKG